MMALMAMPLPQLEEATSSATISSELVVVPQSVGTLGELIAATELRTMQIQGVAVMAAMPVTEPVSWQVVFGRGHLASDAFQRLLHVGERKPPRSDDELVAALKRIPVQSARIRFLHTLSPAELTFVAERIGAEFGSDAIPLLLMLLQHHRPVVREGAVLGLAHHVEEPRVHEALARVARFDTSNAVREVAQDALEG